MSNNITISSFFYLYIYLGYMFIYLNKYDLKMTIIIIAHVF